MNFKSTIGLEVHFELKTKSKIFSPSPVTYGAEVNTATNVIDWGMPGVLPMAKRFDEESIFRVADFIERSNKFYEKKPTGLED